ncbi:MAG: bifunctional riboflavin kinase/FAD synthetase [Flavobacteriales bacterium]|nr:bifunctional riboflavin kinase/FAD synthetase [Flavobacteriales bacterium]
MNVYKGFQNIQKIPNPVLTIGTFDGVHLGHQKIIEQLNREAEEIGGESVLFTFYPHPRMVLYPDDHGLQLIQTQVEKIDKLRRMGLQNVIIHPFSREFSRLSALEFVRDYLVNRLHVKKMVIGYDHQFGKNREGSIDFLKEVSGTYGFEVREILAQEIDEVNISSTKIRNALLAGDMELTTAYLGEPYEFFGKVIAGQAIGRELGYPTANIDIESEIKILPKSGVYAANVLLPDGSVKEGMLNIGVRPSVGMATNKTCIEIHVLDFNGDLYGSHVTVQLLSRFRSEKKFDSLFELTEQLQQDEKDIRSYFSTQL